MVYLEYHIQTKQVIEIHETEPTVSNDYDYAISDFFAVGDEFERTIWINSVDDDKNLTSVSAIRNNPNARRIMQENQQLRDDLNEAIMELSMAIAIGGNS